MNDQESTQIFYTLVSPTSVQCPLRKFHLKKSPPKRAKRPTREIDIDNSCEVTRDRNMICPITCRCHNSLLDIREKTREVSQILRSTRKIWKMELIAILREERENPPPPGKGERRTKEGGGEPGERRTKEGGGEPAGPIKKIDTAGPHEPGTTHARPKREPPPRNRHR